MLHNNRVNARSIQSVQINTKLRFIYNDEKNVTFSSKVGNYLPKRVYSSWLSNSYNIDNHNSKMMQQMLIIYKRSFKINIDFNFNTIVWGFFFSNPLHVVFIRLGARGYFFMTEHS
jgi:hypothetical protein